MTATYDDVVVAPRPFDENERLRALYRSRLLDSEAEAAFDDLAQLAAHVCRVPIAAVNFLDEDVQFGKAAVGVDRRLMGVPRDSTVCSYAILQEDALEVPDLALDARTRGNPVLSRFGLRYYAGAPVRTREGHALGTVCVFDLEPRSLTPGQIGALAALARQAAVLVEWRTARPSLDTSLSRRRAVGR